MHHTVIVFSVHSIRVFYKNSGLSVCVLSVVIIFILFYHLFVYNYLFLCQSWYTTDVILTYIASDILRPRCDVMLIAITVNVKFVIYSVLSFADLSRRVPWMIWHDSCKNHGFLVYSLHVAIIFEESVKIIWFFKNYSCMYLCMNLLKK